MNNLELAKLKANLLSEIGDASKEPYGPIDTLTDDEGERQYGFSTDSGTIYEVKVETYAKPGKPIKAIVSFGIIDEDGEISYDAQTGENDIYRIMSTILTIVKKDLKSNPADAIVFVPSKREGGNKDKDSMSNVRTKLYSRYIKAHWPNAEITRTIPGDIQVILKP